MFKFLSEIGPLIAFFAGYYFGGIQGATLYMLITSIVCIVTCYLIEGKVSTLSLVSSGVLLISGSIALISGNSMFIKIKPTILYVIFGSIFFISSLRNKPFIKYLLESVIQLEEKGWKVLSYRASSFFLIMAILNEIIWRNYSELTWVKFKVFGALPVTLIFILLQIPFLLKNKLPGSFLNKPPK